MFTTISKWWRNRQRNADLRILWPRIRELSQGDIEIARCAFMYHCKQDAAWFRDYSDDEIKALVQVLD